MKAYSREFLEQLYQTLYTIRVFETARFLETIKHHLEVPTCFEE